MARLKHPFKFNARLAAGVPAKYTWPASRPFFHSIQLFPKHLESCANDCLRLGRYEVVLGKLDPEVQHVVWVDTLGERFVFVPGWAPAVDFD